MDSRPAMVRRQRRNVRHVVRRHHVIEGRVRASSASESDCADYGHRRYLPRLSLLGRMLELPALVRRVGIVHARDEPDAADTDRSRRSLVQGLATAARARAALYLSLAGSSIA